MTTPQTPVAALMTLVREYGKICCKAWSAETESSARSAWNEIEASASALAAMPAGFVAVPLSFVQGFNTLAHNYSLRAVPPDYYHGTEGDAFSAAYKRCGADLAELRTLLAAPTPPAVPRVVDKAELKRLVSLVFGEEFQITRAVPTIKESLTVEPREPLSEAQKSFGCGSTATTCWRSRTCTRASSPAAIP